MSAPSLLNICGFALQIETTPVFALPDGDKELHN